VAVLTGPDPGDDRATRDAHRAAVGWLAEIARLRRSAPIHLACCLRPKAEMVTGQVGDTRESASAIPIRSAVHRLSSLVGGPHPTAGQVGRNGPGATRSACNTLVAKYRASRSVRDRTSGIHLVTSGVTTAVHPRLWGRECNRHGGGVNRPGGSGYWAPSLWSAAVAGRGEGPHGQEDRRPDREPRHVKATMAERPGYEPSPHLLRVGGSRYESR
jgi:hypothetical protein